MCSRQVSVLFAIFSPFWAYFELSSISYNNSQFFGMLLFFFVSLFFCLLVFLLLLFVCLSVVCPVTPPR